MIVLDPVTTFFVYIIAMLVIFSFCALAADLWSAKVERRLRDQARAEARAKRMEERGSFLDAWQ